MKFTDVFRRKALDVSVAAPTAPPQTTESGQVNQSTVTNFYKDQSCFGTYSSTSLLGLNMGWAGICSEKNASIISTTPYKLMMYVNATTSKAKWVKSKELSPKEVLRVKSFTSRMDVKTADKIEYIEEHPVYDLFKKVNDYQNYTDLIRLTSIYMDVLGNAFWLIEKVGDSVANIWPLLSEYMSIVIANGLVTGYKYQVPNSTVRYFKREQVIHFKTLSTGDLVIGSGCLRNVAIDAERMQYYDKFEAALAKNNGRPDFMLKYGGKQGLKLNEKTRNEIERQFGSKYGGVDRQGRVMVSDSDWEIITLGWSPKELQFIEGRKDARQIISTAFGVPTALLDTESVDRSNVETALYLYQKFAITPRLTRIAEKLNSEFLPLWDDNLFIVYDDVVPENQADLIAKYIFEVTNGIRSADEIRIEMGYGARPAGGQM